MYTRPTPALIGALGLLERAIGYTRGSLHFVGAADLARPTPCREWDLRALLEHLNDSLVALREAAELGHVELGSASDELAPASDGARGADIVTTVRGQAGALLGAWTNRDGAALVRVADTPLTADVLAGTGALEVAVHGWDIARACRRRHPLPAPLAADLLALVPSLVSDQDRPARFAAPVALPPAAPAADRLLAALGRRQGDQSGRGEERESGHP